jgi:hypothetical protein
MAIREITGKFPSEAIYQSIVDALGETPDLEKLEANRTEWTKRGYNPNAFTWAIDWYKTGIPGRNGNGHSPAPEVAKTSEMTQEQLQAEMVRLNPKWAREKGLA